MTTVRKKRIDIPLILTMLLTAFLNGYNIWTDKYVNTYYTSAVASMLQSFRNFFFGALDSAGFVTVDKPPVTFWIQTLFAWIFGLHGWSVILPQALAGIGSVLLIYLLVKPTFGLTGARLAALAMACTPVAVAVARTNNIDSLLVFTLLLATWLLFRGVKQDRKWSTLGAFAMIGLAFNMKMLQAYMVLPAFFLFYILAAKANWKKKLITLTASTLVCAIISVSWAVVVDSIPQDERPYIGSSESNSVLELAFGYNGVSRLTGDQGPGGGGGGMPPGAGQQNGEVPPLPPGVSGSSTEAGGGSSQPAGQPPQNSTSAEVQSGSGTEGQTQASAPPFGERPGDDGRGGQGGGGGAFNIGTAGPFRLFQSSLSGQASWLLLFALIGCVGLFANVRKHHFTEKHKEALFWLAWLVPVAGFFSIAGFFHQYYLIMLAPPIAALVGAGWTEMTEAYRARTKGTFWRLPAAVAVTSVFQWYIVHPYDDVIGAGWSIAILVLGLITALSLVILAKFNLKFTRATAIASLFVLLVGPLYWAATPITYGQNSMIPAAGPTSEERGGMGMGRGGQEAGSLNEKLYNYLKSGNTGEKYFFAATDYGTAAPYIIEKGETVIDLGGFSGNDPVLSVEQLEELVNSGQLKYFLVSGGRGGNSEITTWIQQHGTEISSEEWGGETETTESSEDNQMQQFKGRFGGNATLYEITPEGGESK